MRSIEFIMEDNQKGTYAGVHFSDDTKNSILKYVKENNIPNPTPIDKMHCTLLYSRKYCPNYKAAGDIKPFWNGTPGGFNVWEGQPDEDGHKPNCLILEFKCDELTNRHNSLMTEHDATYDFPEYKTHITLSYDIGEMDINNLPKYTSPIEITNEYGEDLDLDWAQNNAKEK